MPDPKNIRLTQAEWEQHRRLTEQSRKLDRFLTDDSWDYLYICRSGVDASGNNDREWVVLPLDREETRAAMQTAKLRIDVELRRLEGISE